MKQIIQTICVVMLLAGLVFSANSRVLKSEMKMDKMKHMEPDYRRGGASREVCPHQYPNNPNSVLTVIDSSANGYVRSEGGAIIMIEKDVDKPYWGEIDLL